MNACKTDSCCQGEYECPTPADCRIPEGTGPLLWPLVSAVVIGSVALICYVVALAAGVMR